ncbi:glycerol-3-phosphate dehydrogenase [Erythrobacter sp. LQ02-29]|uniref:glycerol-3-phosphate dehydrogenase n=1 Tax=Erythrobacter sp. LQ02-29 TaxID=2920384 RepID=UPI001F4EC001|nr:glycerol-3-phosphate dehydrogenase [Erythrobacter sp. LQ02-29]MCP9221573.1 glycerol-3-phosphate dehydrogenase [Erythrobacter sp. LQ02-29]
MQDILVIGGGVNGAGIARDAAGRGLAVTLVEKDDLAAHTSSASTKLVHGGLRYLEQYEFRLVREALAEREVLLRIAPHIVWPLRFVLPHDAGLRPRWMLRVGLFLYDRIGGKRTLPGSRGVDLSKPPHGGVLQDRLKRGFEYSDCWVEDSRLTVLNAMDASERGADIRTRTECIALERIADGWHATLSSGETIAARAVVNAAGPWMDDVAAMGGVNEAHLRLVKGSHLIVRRQFEGEQAYIFQNGDGRICFAIPYEHDYTLIGTTDQLFEGDRNDPEISAREQTYLLDAVNEYFADPVTPDDIVSTYSGIRPLYEDESASNSTVTRDYVFAIDAADGAAPLLSVYGGKITTYRRLAEHALEKLAAHLTVSGEEWTGNAPLPGGRMPDGFDAFVADAARRYPWMGPRMRLRLARAYGNRMHRWLGETHGMADLGARMGGDLYAAELAYLAEHEFARTAQDALWRRSKLGLHLTAGEIERVERWFQEQYPDFA